MEGRRLRRSTRSKKQKRYTTDAFEGIESLVYVSSDSGSTSTPVLESDIEDKEFAHEEVENASEEAEDTDEASVSAVVSTGDESTSELDLGFEDDIVLNYRENSQQSTKRRYNEEKRSLARDRAALQETFTRGFIESFANNAKEERILTITGSGKEDLIAYVKGRDQWMNAYSLPSQAPVSGRGGGITFSPFHTPERRQREIEIDWSWYYDQGGSENFRKFEECGLSGRMKVHPDDWPEDRISAKYVIGPVDQQSIHELSGGTAVDLGNFFGQSSQSPSSTRHGWILNFGSEVQCLEWATNCRGTEQYLAVSSNKSLMEMQQANSSTDGWTGGLSAFSPCPETLSQLYLYEVKLTEDPSRKSQLKSKSPPVLRGLVSFPWNRLRALKWCPVPNRPPKPASREIQLGLFAGIWLDGYVRVLDLSISPGRTQAPSIVHYKKAAFQARPPNTVCTAITWLSAHAIAASCADGSVGIWDIADGLGKHNPRPWFYKSLHHSYILNIVSGYPSRPTYVFTSCADGYSKMTDVRDDRADTVYAARHRIMLPALAWTDVCQVFLNADDSFTLEGHFVRFFYSTSAINRFDGLILDIATSHLHPYVLIACADGNVVSVNIAAKLRSRRGESIRQTWFNYEWRNSISSQESTNAEQEGTNERSGAINSSQSNSDVKGPLGRFVDGFKPENQLLNHSAQAKSRQTVQYTTIHEGKTAIRRVAWNPNPHCGTWAAAATASGLIRIEDLGIQQI